MIGHKLAQQAGESILQLREQPAAFKMDETELKARIQARLGRRSSGLLELYRKSRPGASPIDLYIDMTTHQWMWVDTTRRCERQVALQGAPFTPTFSTTSRRRPSVQPSRTRAEAVHGNEIPFKFDHPENNPSSGNKPERFQAAKNMSRAWPLLPALEIQPQRDSEVARLHARPACHHDPGCTMQGGQRPMREERLAWLEMPDQIGVRPS